MLNVVSVVLLGLSGWLYFNSAQPGGSLSVYACTAAGSAGIVCVISRIVVGVRRQLLLRR